MCPICNKLHANEETQSFEVLACADRISKKAHSLTNFRRLKNKFEKWMDSRNIDGIEARGFLAETDLFLKRLAEHKTFFGKRSTEEKAKKMKEKFIGARVKIGEKKRPKQMCPICFHFHYNSAEILDECWQKALKGDISTTFEFKQFLEDNHYGELEL